MSFFSSTIGFLPRSALTEKGGLRVGDIAAISESSLHRATLYNCHGRSRRRVYLTHIVALCSILALPRLLAAQTSIAANAATLGAIPDSMSGNCQQPGTAKDVTFTVNGLAGPVVSIAVTMNVQHAFVGDLLVQLIAPGGASHDIFGYTGATDQVSQGDGSVMAGAYTFADTTASSWWAAAAAVPDNIAIAVGTYATSQIGGAAGTGANTQINPIFAGLNPNGVWTLRFRDGCAGATGTVNVGTTLLIGTPAPVVDPQPPTSLTVDAVAGNMVTLRWTPPTTGPAPTGYVLTGGIAPGEVLASIPTASASPILSFTAPNGAFRVRVHSQAGANQSGSSNEVPLFVNVPVPPSAPKNLLASVNGATLSLAWKNTFEGAAPQSVVLEVVGTLSGSIPLGVTESFEFGGVPPGTYNLSVRATNGAGTSAPSNVVTVTFPGACLSAPQPPSNFLAYRIGSTVFLIWDPATTGPAPSGFVLNVSGAFVGNVPTTTRSISGVVGPGVYQFSVAAASACGTSAPTAVQSLTIP